MKMKKLLSIGALTLAMTCSVSVTASAAENTRPNSLTVVKELCKKYIAGDEILSGVGFNKDTKISSIMSDAEAQKAIEKVKTLSVYEKPVVQKIIATVEQDLKDDNNKVCNTVNHMLEKVDYKEYKTYIEKTRTALEAIDATEGLSRVKKEEVAFDILKATVFNNFDVSFGKNADNTTTVSIEKGNTIVLQITFDNVKNLLDTMSSVEEEDFNMFKTKIMAVK